MKTLTLVVTIFLSAGAVSAQTQDILIMGGDSQDEFLGCLSCSEYDSNSVWSQYGRYGWQNKYGVWNRYGQHANPYGSYSACNQYGQNGPVLVDRAGNFYGRLSVNQYVADGVCGPQGVPRVCTALRVMCADT
ncbi:MAG: hypothetical protein EON89_08780 [Brevundimonas sp.]|nr:MAG: hypothetical protein EON89_08780 [Brevundimonas sp.]